MSYKKIICNEVHFESIITLLSDVCLFDVCLSVAYIGPKSITGRPRKTKIGTEVAHVTRDSDTMSKGQRSSSGGGGILWRPPTQLVKIEIQNDRQLPAGDGNHSHPSCSLLALPRSAVGIERYTQSQTETGSRGEAPRLSALCSVIARTQYDYICRG